MNDIYKNIRERRLALGLSQDELAQKVGYKDRTSIAKIEAGKVDLPQSKIVALSQALECSPSSLVGWDNKEPDTIAAHHDGEDWSEEELEEIEQFKEFVKMRRAQKKQNQI